MIQLITFDLDNTLWDVTPVLLHAEKQLQQWIQENLPQAEPHYQRDNLLALRRQFVSQRPDLAKLPTTLRKAILSQCFQQAGLTGSELEEQVENAFAHFLEARNQIEFFPETIPLLERLNQDFTLIALSNGNADVHRVGLGHYFSAHFSAESTGKPKPHPAMFEAALRHSGVTPEQAIHIGDHPEEDINAAQKLGYRTIWLNKNKQNKEDNCQPDREVFELNQVVSAIRDLLD